MCARARCVYCAHARVFRVGVRELHWYCIVAEKTCGFCITKRSIQRLQIIPKSC